MNQFDAISPSSNQFPLQIPPVPQFFKIEASMCHPSFICCHERKRGLGSCSDKWKRVDITGYWSKRRGRLGERTELAKIKAAREI